MNLLNEKQIYTCEKKISEFNSLYPNYKLIYLTITGSKMYGLDTEN